MTIFCFIFFKRGTSCSYDMIQIISLEFVWATNRCTCVRLIFCCSLRTNVEVEKRSQCLAYRDSKNSISYQNIDGKGRYYRVVLQKVTFNKKIDSKTLSITSLTCSVTFKWELRQVPKSKVGLPYTWCRDTFSNRPGFLRTFGNS